MKKESYLTFVFVSLAMFTFVLSCGPSCPEAKNALDDSQIMSEDVARVNRLVAKRNAAVEQATGNVPTQTIERLQFSAEALKMAIVIQLRIIKLSPRYENAAYYRDGGDFINEMRCYFDGLLDSETVYVSNYQGRKLRKFSEKFSKAVGSAGKLELFEQKKYLKTGIQIMPK